MTGHPNTRHPSELAARAGSGTAEAMNNALEPPVGLMVRPFPEPGPTLTATMEQLQMAAIEPPADESELRELAQMPRPWDPATCTGRMRAELWAWLDVVAMWVNEEQLWNVTRPGIPECWPEHPHLVHDLAVLACSRYYTSFAVTPAALEDWHRYGLPAFLERLRDRLREGCQPGRHQPRPRNERDESHASTPMRSRRKQRYRDDVDQAGEQGTAATAAPDSGHDYDQLHDGW